jgi:hypothetical protein
MIVGLCMFFVILYQLVEVEQEVRAGRRRLRGGSAGRP